MCRKFSIEEGNPDVFIGVGVSYEMTPYLGKFKPGDNLITKEGEDLRVIHEAFTDFPHKDVYWYPSNETIELLRGKKLIVESCYYFHGGYPIYVLVFDNDGQEYEARICEVFLQRQMSSADAHSITSTADISSGSIIATRSNSKITPTLFIALGGTGAEIALRLRRRILSHVWGGDDNRLSLESLDQFPLAQFIYYDLDVASGMERRKGTASDPLAELVMFTEEEKLVFPLDIDKYFHTDGELNAYRHIASWFPLTRKKFLELGIHPEDGAGQIRALSRLYFFDKYETIRSMIESKMAALLSGMTNQLRTERLNLRVEPGTLRVVVIASTAGGTGSGAFLNMGYLAKWLANQRVRGARVDLMLVLPSGFYSVGKTRIEANTYASLMELETCMTGKAKYVTSWSHSEEPYLSSTPYDDVYLVDTANLAQKKTARTTDIFDMVADILFEDFIPSDFSSRKSRVSIYQMQWKVVPFSPPVDAQKYGSMKMKYSRAYSTFGQSVIETQAEQHGQEIPHSQTNDNSLIKMLEEMSPSERKALFQNCLEMAMPWIEANVEGIWAVNPDQYVCAIGVYGAESFVQKFGAEFKSAIPTHTGLTSDHIGFYETDVPGKLTCYVELSGIPLTALTHLSKWRESYDEESSKIPVHTHKDKTLFVHPMVLSSGALDRLAEHFKLYIQGIVLGVLKVRVDDPEERVYCLKVSGEELSIGNERSIRLGGFGPSGYAFLLQRKIADALDRIKSPAQYAGLIVLYDFYARYVYPPAIVRDGLCDAWVTGFANIMCAALGKEALKALKEKSTQGTDTDLIARLKGYGDEEPSAKFDTLDIWTNEIEGSETDVYEYEVGASHLPKRILKPEVFNTDWLESRFKIGAEKQEEYSCSSCGEWVEGNPEFCPHCGNQIKSGKKCTGCGCAIEGNSKFCPECGKQVSPDPKRPGCDVTVKENA